MNKEKLSLSISNLERRIKILVNDYQSLNQEIASLKVENNELKELIRKKDLQIIDFQNKYKISKIVRNVRDGETDHSELKNLLNEYIREIDKCILHLTQA
jgi:chromosome segregation ATPase